MIYLLTEIVLFLVVAFALGWWLGRSQARGQARARVVDVTLAQSPQESVQRAHQS